MLGDRRRAGILLHPTSLPSRYGIGDFGPAAYRWVDFLVDAGQTLWQVLPLIPPDAVGSPYASSSAFAGNWLLVSPERLIAQGWLPPMRGWSQPAEPVQYREVIRRKRQLLWLAWLEFQRQQNVNAQTRFRKFRIRELSWLEDWALFSALKEHIGESLPWTRWEQGIRHRHARTLRVWRERLSERIRFHEFLQWLFDEQWRALKRYANERGIQIIGDVPLFVTRDSADTWTNPKNFHLDRLGRPTIVAGVPPDYFSPRGQVWGDPLYNWDNLNKDGFRWWLKRFERSFALYDIVRLDHFRGYVSVWAVRAKSASARHGSWHGVPGQELFGLVGKKFRRRQFIAEDLGVITEEVLALRNALRFPGVRVLQFGFDDLGSVHALGNISRRSVLYTGTHDNNTTPGWFGEEAQRHERRNILKFFHATERTIAPHMVRAAYHSRANTVIVPLQDVLNLGSTARMNTPGTRKGNWQWRFRASLLTTTLARRLRRLVKATKR